MLSETKSLALKKELITTCHRYVDHRIDLFQQAIDLATKAAREEVKSSAGDKYETSRAMMHLEIEKNTSQLAQVIKSKKVLTSIGHSSRMTTAQIGAGVLTNSNNYYLAISAEQVLIRGINFIIISPVSPMGQLLIGLKAGDSFSFRDKAHLVLEVI